MVYNIAGSGANNPTKPSGPCSIQSKTLRVSLRLMIYSCRETSTTHLDQTNSNAYSACAHRISRCRLESSALRTTQRRWAMIAALHLASSIKSLIARRDTRLFLLACRLAQGEKKCAVGLGVAGTTQDVNSVDAAQRWRPQHARSSAVRRFRIVMRVFGWVKQS